MLISGRVGSVRSSTLVLSLVTIRLVATTELLELTRTKPRNRQLSRPNRKPAVTYDFLEFQRTKTRQPVRTPNPRPNQNFSTTQPQNKTTLSTAGKHRQGADTRNSKNNNRKNHPKEAVGGKPKGSTRDSKHSTTPALGARVDTGSSAPYSHRRRFSEMNRRLRRVWAKNPGEARWCTKSASDIRANASKDFFGQRFGALA